MEKTTVYLSEEQAAALRRASAATGRSQSELIRDGVDLITSRSRRRTFASRAAATGDDPDVARRVDELLARALDARIDRERRA
jgi:Arc/MetJ-type ribon-helix-helix transcriptional regulator